MSFNAKNQIQGFSYGARGGLISDGVFTYSYDGEGRLSSIGSPASTSFTYNALGQQAVENANGTKEDYLFDPAGHFVARYVEGFGWDNVGSFYLGDRLLGSYYTSHTYFRHVNVLGGENGVTDWRGSENGVELFDPWGVQVPSLTAGTPVIWDFAGFEHGHTNVALWPGTFREHHPSLGRWLTPDPLAGDITNPQSLNRYAYVLNNPTSAIDPSGMDCRQTNSCPAGYHPPSCGGMVCADNPATFCGSFYCGFNNLFAPDPFSLMLSTACSGGECTNYFDFNGATVGDALATQQGPPPPSSKPPRTGFTLGIRGPNQTYRGCLTQNATNYSAGGVFDLVTGSDKGGSFLGQVVAGNTFTGLYAGFFGGSASDAAAGVAATTPDLLNASIGAPLSWGRRSADIMSLNLAGKGGLPLAISPASEIGAVKSFLGFASRALNLGLDATMKGAIDGGLFGAELIGCAIPQ